MAKSKAPATTPADGDKPLRHLYLIDGSGYLFRAYHALPPMNRPDGTPINAVFGFCRMLVADLLDNPEIDHIAMILDAGSVTFRNKIYDKYKANRPDPPEDLIPQFPLIREAARAFNVTVCELDGYEADDLIATYARMAVEAGGTCTIVSSDKDLMQLVRPGVELMDPIKKVKLGPEAVFEKFGVTPDKVVDVQALAGDSTDNVPGAPRHRHQDRAPSFINEYGNLEALLERTKEIKLACGGANRWRTMPELIRISKQLVTLRDDVPTPAEPEAFDKRRPDPNVLLPGLEQQGFRTLLQRFTERAGRGQCAGRSGHRGRAGKEGDRARPCARGGLAQEAQPRVYRGRLRDDPGREAARRMDRRSDARQGTLAFDCETDGLDSNNAGLVGVSLALLEGPWGDINSTRRRAAYMPLMHRSRRRRARCARSRGRWRRQGCRQAAGRTDPLQDGDRQAEAAAGRSVGPEGRPEHQIRHGGVPPARDRDRSGRSTTMLISFVLDAGKNNHGMDELAELHLGQKTIKFSDVAGSGAKQVTFDKVPLDKARDYAAEDADVTRQALGAPASRAWCRARPRRCTRPSNGR